MWGFWGRREVGVIIVLGGVWDDVPCGARKHHTIRVWLLLGWKGVVRRC